MGTRPQIIKSARVFTALRDIGVECDIINTGQHYDYEMNREFFEEFRLPDPSADLNVGAGAPAQQVSAIVGGLAALFAKSGPDMAVVPGDTNSALAAGIACAKSGVPIAHLESGCRSGDIRMAEEVNRRLLDHMSQVLLCPTSSCVRNVKAEHVIADEVHNVGDTMYDSLLKLRPRIDESRSAAKLGLSRGGYAFMTLHRAETVDDPDSLRKVLGGISTIPCDVVFAVHPRTKGRMREFGVVPGPNVTLLDPLPYVETLSLVESSRLVITDSGGLQKEAYWLGRPSLVTRDTTEWGEIVRAKAAYLVGNSPRRIREGYRTAIRIGRGPFGGARRIFGDGNASKKAAKAVARYGKTRGKDGN